MREEDVNNQAERRTKDRSDFLLQGGILALASFIVTQLVPLQVQFIGELGGYDPSLFSQPGIVIFSKS